MIEFSNAPELSDLWQSLPEFEQQLMLMAKTLNISLANYPIDHISVRCHHLETAKRWQAGLLKCGQLLSDNIINGRSICLFELEKPLLVAFQPISIIELPFPKDKIYPQETWEHIEMVIDVTPNELEDTARTLLPNPLPEGFNLKMSQPKGHQERLPNPTLAVSNGIITIKYHPFTIKKIIESEK